MNRRALVSLALVAPALVACSNSPDIQSLEKQIADILTKVQQGVKDACTLVPTANSVLAVLQVLAGSNAAVAGFIAATADAIKFIAQACPQPTPTATAGPITTKVNGKDVPIVFY